MSNEEDDEPFWDDPPEEVDEPRPRPIEEFQRTLLEAEGTDELRQIIPRLMNSMHEKEESVAQALLHAAWVQMEHDRRLAELSIEAMERLDNSARFLGIVGVVIAVVGVVVAL